MRNYGTNAQIWGGEPDCTHTWGKHLRHPNFDSRSPEEKRRQGGTVGNNLKTEQNSPMDGGTVCTKCGAWKGELGSEPNVLMFIDNLTMIFAEIYRVMKPTGTVWVNLDDSYNSGGNVRSGPDQVSNPFHTRVNRSKVGYAKTSIGAQPVRRKSLMNIPARFAIAMTDRLGFVQRNRPIWQKDSVSPESAKDRFTHEYEDIMFFTKRPKNYYFKQQLEPYRGPALPRNNKVMDHHLGLSVPQARAGDGDPLGRNRRDVLRINTEPQQEEHYAMYPTKLVGLFIDAGCPEEVCTKCGHVVREVFEIQSKKTKRKDTGAEPTGYEQQTSTGWQAPIMTGKRIDRCKCDAPFEPGIVYDPFMGSGTTALVAHRMDRHYIGSELSEKFHKIATDRLASEEMKGKLFT